MGHSWGPEFPEDQKYGELALGPGSLHHPNLHDDEIVDQMRKRVIELKAGQVVRDQARGVYGSDR